MMPDGSLGAETVLKEHPKGTDDRGDRVEPSRIGRGKPVDTGRGNAATDHSPFPIT
jgi:hypothetical protein